MGFEPSNSKFGPSKVTLWPILCLAWVASMLGSATSWPLRLFLTKMHMTHPNKPKYQKLSHVPKIDFELSNSTWPHLEVSIWGKMWSSGWQDLVKIQKISTWKSDFWHGCTCTIPWGATVYLPIGHTNSAKVSIWTVMTGRLSSARKTGLVLFGAIFHLPPPTRLLRCFSPKQRWVMTQNLTGQTSDMIQRFILSHQTAHETLWKTWYGAQSELLTRKTAKKFHAEALLTSIWAKIPRLTHWQFVPIAHNYDPTKSNQGIWHQKLAIYPKNTFLAVFPPENHILPLSTPLQTPDDSVTSKLFVSNTHIDNTGASNLGQTCNKVTTKPKNWLWADCRMHLAHSGHTEWPTESKIMGMNMAQTSYMHVGWSFCPERQWGGRCRWCWDMMVMWGCRGSSHRTYGVWRSKCNKTAIRQEDR